MAPTGSGCLLLPLKEMDQKASLMVVSIAAFNANCLYFPERSWALILWNILEC